MKKIFLILILCSFCSAQWVIQNTPVTTGLHDVTFANNKTGWACGEGGVILKTTNNGTNWIQQNSGTGNILEGIHAVDSQYVYCVGWWNTILKSTNGGINWLSIRNGTVTDGISFYGLYFLNRTTGWLLRNEYVMRTHDGCISYDSIHLNYTYLRDVYFKDSINGVVCCDAAGIFKSTDGGISWNQIQIPLYNFYTPNLYKESFIGNNGWVVGGSISNNLGGICWKTTNFGATWDSVARVPYPNNIDNYCVFFSSLNTGWCGATYGYICKTTNGGFNWYQQQVPSQNYRESMWFYNDSIGWVVGGIGQILYTTTSGQWVGLNKISVEIPDEFKLFQNYPNPFNSETIIEFEISKGNSYTLEIYDILGRKIKSLFNETKPPGKYRINLNSNGIVSGVYFYKLSSSDYTETKKLILLK